ncbi:MAG: cysteine synthase family protein [Planctomycetes bacterium]|nr:cysteine synthase family protein [Planctomycetota bacterium]
MNVVGNTPLVEVEGVLAKLECTNPCGSIKDRIAQYILEKSEQAGTLRPGMHIVEATSGNTGIAFAWLARRKGYPITIVMPENMTEERKQIVRELGAELVLCSREGSFAEAARIRDELAARHGWFNPDQFSNPYNTECHFETTGREILDQVQAFTRRPIGAFVAGVGTGGTLIGVGGRIKQAFPAARIVAVEPAESAVMSGGPAGAHEIAGIGDGFIPALAGNGKGGLHPLIDEVVRVGSAEARAAAKRLADAHGYCVGISSGANLLAAQEVGRRAEVVVTVFPDSYLKYRSLGLAHCKPGACRFEHDPIIGSGPDARGSGTGS